MPLYNEMRPNLLAMCLKVVFLCVVLISVYTQSYSVLIWVLFVLIFSTAFMLFINFITQFFSNDLSCKTVHVHWGQIIIRETWVILRLYLLEMPFGSSAIHHEKNTPGYKPELAVFLVHGFLCNKNMWNIWREWLDSHSNWQFIKVDVPAWYWNTNDNANFLLHKVKAYQANNPGVPIVLIGHSMGGLAVRLANDHLSLPVICLASPHKGTIWSHIVSWREHGPARRGMQWLNALNKNETELSLNIYSQGDQIVIPWQSGAYFSTQQFYLQGFGHLSMLNSSRVQHAVELVLLDAVKNKP